jgi:hypothetical protein
MAINEKVKKLLTEAGEIAKTIRDQIGHKALYMFGASSFAWGPKSGSEELTFRIGKNAKGINAVGIFYDRGHDLYDITFYTMRGFSKPKTEIVKGIDAENLARVISEHTGLAYRLF